MRILMLEPSPRDQGMRIRQRLDDGVVGIAFVAVVLEHAFALEAGRFLGEHPIGADGERDRRVDAALAQQLLRVHPDDVVVGAVPRRRMHEAGAHVVGDVITVEQGDGEVVAKCGERVGDNQAFKTADTAIANELPLLDLGSPHNLVDKTIFLALHFLGQYHSITHFKPIFR